MSNEMAECWECKKPIGTSASNCPHCGADQSKKPIPFPTQGCAALIACVVVIFGGARLLHWMTIGSRSEVATQEQVLKVMDTANQEERDSRSLRLSVFSSQGLIGHVSHDRPNLRAQLNVKDGYEQSIGKTQSEIDILAYRTAFGLPEATTDFPGTMTVVNAAGRTLQKCILENGTLKAK